VIEAYWNTFWWADDSDPDPALRRFATQMSDRPKERIPALDGWRGVAIVLVMIDHLQSGLLGHYWRPWLQSGQHGVTLFFVLSGYLITGNLLSRQQSLKSFYMRRLFRLMPVAWAYILFLLIVHHAFPAQTLSFKEVLACVFFYRNYLAKEGILTGHFWSLSIEEQFYLLWPTVLFLAGPRKAKWSLAGVALAVALFRLTHWDAYDKLWVAFRTEVRADALCVGCLLALALHSTDVSRLIAKWAARMAPLAGAVLLVCIFRFAWLPPLTESVAITVLLGATILRPHNVMARILALRPLAWLGTISYSFYVWQQFFFLYHGRATILLMCTAPVFVLGSYYWIEQPCVRFGRSISAKYKGSNQERLATGAGMV
jgi:peptidoglycan/LPS O-acetylase OafA/YrhL